MTTRASTSATVPAKCDSVGKNPQAESIPQATDASTPLPKRKRSCRPRPATGLAAGSIAVVPIRPLVPPQPIPNGPYSSRWSKDSVPSVCKPIARPSSSTDLPLPPSKRQADPASPTSSHASRTSRATSVAPNGLRPLRTCRVYQNGRNRSITPAADSALSASQALPIIIPSRASAAPNDTSLPPTPTPRHFRSISSVPALDTIVEPTGNPPPVDASSETREASLGQQHPAATLDPSTALESLRTSIQSSSDVITRALDSVRLLQQQALDDREGIVEARQMLANQDATLIRIESRMMVDKRQSAEKTTVVAAMENDKAAALAAMENDKAAALAAYEVTIQGHVSKVAFLSDEVDRMKRDEEVTDMRYLIAVEQRDEAAAAKLAAEARHKEADEALDDAFAEVEEIRTECRRLGDRREADKKTIRALQIRLFESGLSRISAPEDRIKRSRTEDL